MGTKCVGYGGRIERDREGEREGGRADCCWLGARVFDSYELYVLRFDLLYFGRTD